MERSTKADDHDGCAHRTSQGCTEIRVNQQCRCFWSHGEHDVVGANCLRPLHSPPGSFVKHCGNVEASPKPITEKGCSSLDQGIHPPYREVSRWSGHAIRATTTSPHPAAYNGARFAYQCCERREG